MRSYISCRFARMSPPFAYEHCGMSQAPTGTCLLMSHRKVLCSLSQRSSRMCARQSPSPGRAQPQLAHMAGPSADGHGRLHLEQRRFRAGTAEATASCALCIATLVCSSRASRCSAAFGHSRPRLSRASATSACTPPAATIAALYLTSVASLLSASAAMFAMLDGVSMSSNCSSMSRKLASAGSGLTSCLSILTRCSMCTSFADCRLVCIALRSASAELADSCVEIARWRVECAQRGDVWLDLRH